MGYARGIYNKNRGNKGQIWDVIAHFLPLLKRNWLQAGKTLALVHVRYVILSLWFAFDFISFEKYCKLNARTCSRWLLPFIILLVTENWCGVERKPENCFLEDMEIYYGVMVRYFYLFKFNYLRFSFCKCFISYKSYVSCAENFNRMVGIVSMKWLVVRWVSWDTVWF